MNNIYAINFAPGFEELVEKLLSRLQTEVLVAEEGFVIARFLKKLDLSKLRFAKGIVEVFDWGDNFHTLKLEVPEYFHIQSDKKFNLRSFEAGKPSKIEPNIREELILSISKSTGLKYSSFNPELDFVLMQRRDGLSYFGFKLEDDSSSKPLKGEINSDIAHLLLELGDLTPQKVILDAFAGNAGISKEIVKSFRPRNLILTERDSKLVNGLKISFKGKPGVKVVASDVVNFLKSDQTLFDLIVADPPWGEFAEVKDLDVLYNNFLQAAAVRLNENGRIVMMSSAKNELTKAAADTDLKVLNKLDVLVSGKKVLVLKLGLE